MIATVQSVVFNRVATVACPCGLDDNGMLCFHTWSFPWRIIMCRGSNRNSSEAKNLLFPTTLLSSALGMFLRSIRPPRLVFLSNSHNILAQSGCRLHQVRPPAPIKISHLSIFATGLPFKPDNTTYTRLQPFALPPLHRSKTTMPLARSNDPLVWIDCEVCIPIPKTQHATTNNPR